MHYRGKLRVEHVDTKEIFTSDVEIIGNELILMYENNGKKMVATYFQNNEYDINKLEEEIEDIKKLLEKRTKLLKKCTGFA